MNAPTGGKAAAAALADFIIVNEELAALVRARLPLEHHLTRFGAELPGRAGELAERVGRRMEAGESLAAAMDAECASLPPAYRAAIVAGVESGQLGSALESLIDSASRLDHMRRITGVALLYPLIIIVVACLLLALVVYHVVPSFAWLNRPGFAPISRLADLPLAVTALAIAVPGILVITTAIWWWRSGRVGGTSTTRRTAPTWLPGTRAVRRWSDAATFAEVLLLLVERELPLDQALRLAAGATNDARLRAATDRYGEAIRRGTDRADKADTARAIPNDFPLLIRLALHHTGNRVLLAGGLRQAASMYRDRAMRAAEWYAEYLPIVLTVAVGGTITVAFTLFVVWPYASTLTELSRWNWR